MSDSPVRSLRIRAALVGVTLIALGALALIVFPPGAGAGLNVDLSLTKADSPDPVQTGDVLTYTITVTNNGPGSVATASVEDKLPNKLDFVSVEATQGTCERNGRNVTCEPGLIGDTQSVTITITVRPSKEGNLSNTATVSATGNVDPNGGNDSDTETTKVTQGPTCGGKSATILGTEDNDVITGTEQRDVISALGGDDEVNSLGGKDALCGKSGNDKLKGKGDADLVKGGGGRDTGKGGGGDDTVKGGPKPDRLRGGSGDDLLAGGGGNDNCRGGSGTDTLKSC
jgi:uncharacterized repeat protein (TIGR01451 family)